MSLSMPWVERERSLEHRARITAYPGLSNHQPGQWNGIFRRLSLALPDVPSK